MINDPLTLSKMERSSHFGRTLLWPIVLIVFFVGSLLLLSLKAGASRIILEGHRVLTIERPSEAFNLWMKHGIKGRTLLYLNGSFSIDQAFIESLNSRFAMMEKSLPSPTDSNYLLLAMYSSIIRKVYHIVPESKWNGVKERLSQFSFVSFDGKRFRLTIEGIPVIITKAR